LKFHALLPVRDEADIIGQCLRHLLSWADAVYVVDTGSLDETWEIVRQFSVEDRRITPLKKDNLFFSEKRLRGWIFHQARQRMRPGDWFLRVDADEFHHIPPPDVVKTRMQAQETIAYHQYYDFHLTSAEVKAWQNGTETFADRNRPIEERRRWFTMSLYTEPRLCRYRESMQWPEMVSFPYNAGYVARERLPIRHYPHRDPVQLDRRCRLRALMLADGENACAVHWAQADWREHIVEESLTDLRYWKTNTNLPELHFTNHLASMPKRVCQRIAHACLVPHLDKLRARYPDWAYPRRLSEELVQRLRKELNV